MSDRPVRYGVIGAGRMGGHTMLKLMHQHPAARATACFEIDASRADTAERMSALSAAGVRICGSLRELLSADDVDVIVNATPHHAHAATTIEALSAGRQVICEKPPAASVADCQAMLDAQQRTGQPVWVHFQHVLRPAARWVNAAICSGRLGRIRRVRVLTLWWRTPEYFRRVDWAGRRMYRGMPAFDGAMLNQTVHYLNQALNFAHSGGEHRVAGPGRLRAALYRFHDAGDLEVEDTAVVAGTLDNDDATELVYAGTVCAADSMGPSRAQEYAGLGDQHRVVIEGEGGTAVWAGRAELHVDGRVETFAPADEGHWPFYFHIQDVLRGAQQPATPLAETVNTVRFVHEAYRLSPIRQCQWTQTAGLAGVLRECVERACLPAELPAPPEWA